ncbi:hypothetical protein DR64_6919 [Paraburkholderia xenovorans LB400]|uniref:hypothetical protein n=1 Tax=Paraburkholderia xenovorans TaxID=36873 RepID=UPI00031E2AC3|nr:hypothetical protein [Paraburkholderia xenovorans]AIP36040.1 hypothetical protein DR64_6919 [Paraburkholderia xenovorans LB400]
MVTKTRLVGRIKFDNALLKKDLKVLSEWMCHFSPEYFPSCYVVNSFNVSAGNILSADHVFNAWGAPR